MASELTAFPLLILGIGNEILTDDGIGPRLVNDLDRARLPRCAIFSQATVGGLELLDLVKEYDELVIIDALKSGNYPPGTVLVFQPSDFEETLHLSNIHDIDFLTALELGKRTGMKIPEKISIIAVEIAEDRVFSLDFSPEISGLYPEILRTVQHAVEKVLAPATRN